MSDTTLFFQLTQLDTEIIRQALVAMVCDIRGIEDPDRDDTIDQILELADHIAAKPEDWELARARRLSQGRLN